MRMGKAVLVLLVALAIGVVLFPQRASAGIVSLTAPTTPNCPAVNGSGGDWCLSNGNPFPMTSFLTQNLTYTGSSAFFAILNNTGMTVSSLDIIFTGDIPENAVLTCGGGSAGGVAKGIQGSGPNPTSGNPTCTVNGQNGVTGVGPGGTGSTLVSFTADYHWGNINWGAGQVFDLQIASFSNGATGTFSSVPEPGTLGLLGIGLLFVGGAIRRYFSS